MPEKKGRTLVTGAGGFVGRAVCATLAAAGHEVRAMVRTVSRNGEKPYPVVVEKIFGGDVSENGEWHPLLHGVDAVVHLAARTHVMHESDEHDLAQYRHINVAGTRRVAAAAAVAGVHRLIYMSSIKVNGESTSARPYTEADIPRPEDAYGISKWEAEQALAEISRESGMETVILRPPLVYGPHVKGNLLTLMRALDRHVPLPLASIRNRRSLIAVANLANAVLRCIESPQAAGKTYLVSDGEDVSTPGLIRRIAAGLGVRPMLFPCPPALLNAAGHVLGRTEQVSRLTGSLQMDSSLIRRELDWKPPQALDEALYGMSAWYRNADV
ncbi:MAG TPA: NAD-dependent epimerase/dehydratase family protein [Burkholderiales bacterium]|nr:NAD-dependent epimerase/dehydratase family protein [Burkholderiales bacterium]